MQATRDQIETYLPQLEINPQRIWDATAGCDEAALRRSANGSGWSAVEILTHVRSCADIWTFSIYAMLAEKEPTLALIDPRHWAKAAAYSRTAFVDSLQSYSLQRFELVRLLRTLSFDAWSRSAEIGGRTHTIFTQVRRIAKHEDEHCLQIEEILRSHLQVR
jgi:hypothetical protein